MSSNEVTPRRVAAKSASIKEVEAALDLISTGLLYLDQNTELLTNLAGSKAVDIAARMNASYDTLQRHLLPLKKSIEVSALESNDSGIDGPTGMVIHGDIGGSEAVVHRVTKVLLDTEKVKDFLGRKLSQYLKKKQDINISFRVRG